MNNQITERQYPRGTFPMCGILFLMFFGFSMLVYTIVLYATQQFGFSNDSAYALNGIYVALLFSTPVLGGVLGSRFLDYRFAISYSCLLAIIGLFILSTNTLGALYVGLSLYIIGSGIFVPCLYVLFGRLYRKDDSRRDSGFTVAYICMNAGGFVAAFSSGFIIENVGFHTIYFLSALFTIGMWLFYLLVIYIYKPKPAQPNDDKYKITYKTRIIGILISLAAVPLLSYLLSHASSSNLLLIGLGIGCALLIAYLASREKIENRKRMFAFLVLIIISLAFWTLYMLVPSVLILFFENYVNRTVFGFTIPTSTVASLNPFFIVTLGPILSYVWIRLTKRGIVISTAAKFATGILLMGFGYLVLVMGLHSPHTAGKVMFFWVVISYALQTLGELFLSPIGFAMVGNLAPARYEGLMMGVWQLVMGVSGAISAFVADLTNVPHDSHSIMVIDSTYSHAFTIYAIFAILVGLLAIYMIPTIQRMSGHANKVALAKALQTE